MKKVTFKKIVVFHSIFLLMLVFLIVVRVTSTDRVNAQKLVRRVLRPFLSGNRTKVVVLFFKDGEIERRKELPQGESVVRKMSSIVYSQVKRKAEPGEARALGGDQVQVKLDNKKQRCIVAFPRGEDGYRIVKLSGPRLPNSPAFALTRKGQREIAQLFD